MKSHGRGRDAVGPRKVSVSAALVPNLYEADLSLIAVFQKDQDRIYPSLGS